MRREWGEHKTHLTIEKSIAAVRRLLERERPISPSVSGILTPQEFAALEHLAQFAAAVKRSGGYTAAVGKHCFERSRLQLRLPMPECSGQTKLLGDWRPVPARRRARA